MLRSCLIQQLSCIRPAACCSAPISCRTSASALARRTSCSSVLPSHWSLNWSAGWNYLLSARSSDSLVWTNWSNAVHFRINKELIPLECFSICRFLLTHSALSLSLEDGFGSTFFSFPSFILCWSSSVELLRFTAAYKWHRSVTSDHRPPDVELRRTRIGYGGL